MVEKVAQNFDEEARWSHGHAVSAAATGLFSQTITTAMHSWARTTLTTALAKDIFSRAQRTSRLNRRARGEAHYESTTSMSDVSFLHDLAHPRASRPTILHIHSLPRFSSLLFSLYFFFFFCIPVLLCHGKTENNTRTSSSRVCIDTFLSVLTAFFFLLSPPLRFCQKDIPLFHHEEKRAKNRGKHALVYTPPLFGRDHSYFTLLLLSLSPFPLFC